MTTETRSLLYDVGGGVAIVLLSSYVNGLAPADERETADRSSIMTGIVSSVLLLYLRDYVFATPANRRFRNRASFWSTCVGVNALFGRHIDSDYSFVLGQGVGRLVYRIALATRSGFDE